MTDLWQYLKNSGGPVVLYGTGNGADKITDALESIGVEVSAVFASDGFVRERFFRGHRVTRFEECLERYPGMKVLMCFGSSRPEVLANVKRISSLCEFYAPDVPVYGDGLFDGAFYEAHRAELDEVRSRLSDERSVRCFDDHIKFKLSGDIRFLEDCETERNDIEREFYRAKTFVDLGAYTGDTALRFAALCPSYEKIVAVEPDKRNFRKLCENTAGLPGVECVNAAAYDRDGELLFARSKGRGSGASGSGEAVPCRSVDSLLADLGGDGLYIKYDVEGSELEALNGAQRTIRRYRPSMGIACYHRNEDLFRIPLRVLRLVPEYRVYMRHSPQIPAWDTEFYFTI